MKCKEKCEVYSRVVGYWRPVSAYNVGKYAEYLNRKEYDPSNLVKYYEDKEARDRQFDEIGMTISDTASESTDF